jgi:amino acid transporter
VAQEQETGLKRDIGFWGSSFLSFNGLVGAGIFALPATLYTQFGTFSPWLFPLFGALALIVALPFSRLAAYHPQSGGPVAYTAPFGPLVAFQIGWIYYVARATALAANSNVFATYAASLWAPLGEGVGRAALILALVGAITAINLVGVKRAIRALDALTLLKALPLFGMALFALTAIAPSWPSPGPAPAPTALEAAALLVFYAFVGFENSVVPAGETTDPRRTIPRALIITLLGTMTLYFLVQLAFVAVMPRGGGGDAPLVEFGRVGGGTGGRTAPHRRGSVLADRQHHGRPHRNAARHLRARPRRHAARLVRPDQHALCDAGQLGPVHGRPDRGAGAHRQLRLAGGGEHAGPDDRLWREHRRAPADTEAGRASGPAPPSGC